MHPELCRDDRGEAVARLQALLNKTGAMLVPDGGFGPGTARVVLEVRTEAGLSPGSHADEALWSWSAAVPEISLDIPAEAVSFIVRHEISSRARYEDNLQALADPGAESGVTIGIGYDLRFSDAARFQRDWGDELSAPVLARLRPWLGKRVDARAVCGICACPSARPGGCSAAPPCRARSRTPGPPIPPSTPCHSCVGAPWSPWSTTGAVG